MPCNFTCCKCAEQCNWFTKMLLTTDRPVLASAVQAPTWRKSLCQSPSPLLSIKCSTAEQDLSTDRQNLTKFSHTHTVVWIKINKTTQEVLQQEYIQQFMSDIFWPLAKNFVSRCNINLDDFWTFLRVFPTSRFETTKNDKNALPLEATHGDDTVIVSTLY